MLYIQETKPQIDVKPNVSIHPLIVQEGMSAIINGTILLGVSIIVFLLIVLSKKIEGLGERIKKDNKHTKIKDEDIETINNILYRILHEYDAIRVFILEFHNGAKTGNGFSYEKLSMTYEVCSVGYVKTARNVRDVPKSIIIEDLVKLKEEKLVELRECTSTNPLLEYGNEIVLLKAIDEKDLNKGCIGISFQHKGYTPIDVKEFYSSTNKIRQLFG